MTPKLLQLYSLRAQVEALIAQEEAELPQVVGCPHPEEKRKDVTTMGGGPPRFYCLECRETVVGKA